MKAIPSISLSLLKVNIAYVTSEGFSGNIDEATLKENMGKLRLLRQNYILELNRSELPKEGDFYLSALDKLIETIN